jgi:surfactin synthase thioesterase subunit
VSWLHRYPPRRDARLRLVCFPHAGGSAAAYRSWSVGLPEWVEILGVQYPGRAERLGEPARTSLPGLADEIAEALRGLADLPYVLFGHSMGAAIAYETARRLPEPAHLVVSGREAPRHSRHGTIHLGSEADLLAALDRFGATPPELLADPEMRELLLGVIAADCELIETYAPDLAATPLRCPVTALLGDADPGVTPREAADWAAITSGPFRLNAFPGDHFFLLAQRDAVLRTMTDLLAGPGSQTDTRSAPAARETADRLCSGDQTVPQGLGGSS